MKKIVLLFVLISGYAFSQSVNDYQYVIVPAKFNFLKNEDQYRLNTLTKLLLEKYGFKAFLSIACPFPYRHGFPRCGHAPESQMQFPHRLAGSIPAPFPAIR